MTIPGLLRDYIAAGFEPGAFWGLTPRLLLIHLEGAEQRLQRDRALTWFSAMLPHLQKPLPLERFVGLPEDRRARASRFHESWDRIDRALARN